MRIVNWKNSSMLLLVAGTQAFRAAPSRAQAASSTRLAANFFDNLQKSFSSMASGGSDSPYYTIGITGASGLVGNAFRDELKQRAEVNGKPVRIVKLQRGTDVTDAPLDTGATETTVTWNPAATTPEAVLSPAVAGEMDAIVHLSGENVATGLGPLGFLGLRPWTQAKKDEIMNSRVVTTKALASVIAATDKPQAFLVSSGINAYGSAFVDDSLEAVDESSDNSQATGFLAEVVRQWEGVSQLAKSRKVRVVNMRTSVVLSVKGGVLGKLYPIFFLGGGGNVGSGKQYFSCISARDQARAMVHILETPSLEGPVNLVTPEPCTNAEFTKAFGNGLSRPTILPFPGFAVSLLFGEMGEELLLGGTKALPTKLLQSNFAFNHPNVELAVKSALEESI